MRAGYASLDITPKTPIDLAGNSVGRQGKSVLDPLSVRALVCEDKAGRRAAILNFDLIWVPEELVDRLRDSARAQGVPSDSLLVSCTHTHSAPEINQRLQYGPKVAADYAAEVERQAAEAMRVAAADLAEVEIAEAQASAPDLVINRRLSVLDVDALRLGRLRRQVANRPNAKGESDDRIAMLWLTWPQPRRSVVIATFGCHPTFLSEEVVSAEYCGRIAGLLSRQAGHAVGVVFLQGFSGDARPRILAQRPFRLWPPRALAEGVFDRALFVRHPGAEAMAKFAERMAERMAAAARNTLPTTRLEAVERRAVLPLRDGALSSGPELRVQRVSLSARHHILALNGEIFSGYANWLRAQWPDHHLLPAGCCNGMVGYVVTDRALQEGGYEPVRSLSTFGLAAPFAQGIEAAVRQTLLSAMPASAGQLDRHRFIGNHGRDSL
ncbi:MAG: hypothetical protein FJX46_15840 [Alphaproteobacteria bacterium]|nr:hypothetical protein [Alphaproteobacteria bacterium]